MDRTAAATIVSVDGHEGPLLARAGEHDIIACRTCGFRHALPLPTAESLETAYRETYYSEEKPDFLARSGEDQAWGELAQRDRLQIFERTLGPSRRRILDIGCGPGFFLKTAQTRGWQAKGIEPSRQAAAHARGLGIDVVEGFFSAESAEGLGRFDAIHLNNVLEHVPDPTGLIGCARAILEPGGILCINVPNDFSPFQIAGRAAAGRHEWWLAPPHHLNYFDFDSAAALLERAGFAVVERTTSFPMELFLMMGEDYIGNDAVGRACHAKRKRFDLALEAADLSETRRAFYRALASAGIGREAVLIAVKS
jgi:SAM-dependent methyltransferase